MQWLETLVEPKRQPRYHLVPCSQLHASVYVVLHSFASSRGRKCELNPCCTLNKTKSPPTLLSMDLHCTAKPLLQMRKIRPSQCPNSTFKSSGLPSRRRRVATFTPIGAQDQGASQTVSPYPCCVAQYVTLNFGKVCCRQRTIQ